MQLEGKNSVYEAVNSDYKIEKILTIDNLNDLMSQKIINSASRKRVKVNYVTKQELDQLSNTGMHQNFIAYVEDFKYCETNDILEFAKQKGESPFVVILDGLEDPHNFGSIIRVCECAGVHGIIIPKNRSVSVTETVARTSAGAISHVMISKVTNINAEIEKLKKQNIWVYALELGGEDIYSSNLTGAIAIVVGSEGFGVSQLTKKVCDGIVTLPMYGSVNSLNASVACGVAVFEANRQRNK